MRPLTLIVALLVAFAVLPATASADVRSVTVTDPVDQQTDSFQPQYRTDLVKTWVSYDPEQGAISVAASFHRPEPGLAARVTLSRFCESGDRESGVPDLTITFGASARTVQDHEFAPERVVIDASASARLEGVGDSVGGPVTFAAPYNTIGATVQNERFRNRDWRCVHGAGGVSQRNPDGDQFDLTYFDGWSPDERPQGCNRADAEDVGHDLLIPRAERRKPSYYRDLVDADMWGLGTVICRDLNRDGKQEMVVQMRCCTGGSLTPWGIFERGSNDRWRLAYFRVNDNAFRLGRAGKRSIKARVPSPYEGGCTSRFRNVVVSWSKGKYRSKTSRPFRLRARC